MTEYIQEQRYCSNCKMETWQTFHRVGNYYLPQWQCSACGKVVED